MSSSCHSPAALAHSHLLYPLGTRSRLHRGPGLKKMTTHCKKKVSSTWSLEHGVLSRHGSESLATSPDMSTSDREVKGTPFCHWLSSGDTTALGDSPSGGRQEVAGGLVLSKSRQMHE